MGRGRTRREGTRNGETGEGAWGTLFGQKKEEIGEERELIVGI